MIKSYLIHYMEPQEVESLHFDLSLISIGYAIIDDKMALFYTDKGEKSIKKKLAINPDNSSPFILINISKLELKDFFSTYSDNKELKSFLQETLTKITPTEENIDRVLEKVHDFGYESLKKNERELLQEVSESKKGK